jgi:hypothetical protein
MFPGVTPAHKRLSLSGNLSFERTIFVIQGTHKGFAIAGVPCFADTFVQGGSSVLRMKFSANHPRHLKPPKRYAQYEINKGYAL